MRDRDFSPVDRSKATLAMLGLVVALLGSTGGFAADPDAAGEPCVGCPDCDAGHCGGEGEDPLTSHHHCCTTCCMSHAPVAFSVAQSAPAPVTARSMVARTAVPVADRSPEALYRPPRA